MFVSSNWKQLLQSGGGVQPRKQYQKKIACYGSSSDTLKSPKTPPINAILGKRNRSTFETKKPKPILVDRSPALKEQVVDKFKNSNSSSNSQLLSSQLHDHTDGLTPVVAMDCEMVGVGTDGTESVLARCSIVNAHGVCLYDKYVQPQEQVTDYRTHVSGIKPSHLNPNTAVKFSVCQREVHEIINGRILVGHGLNNDLQVLLLTHPKWLIRDTTKYKPFCPIRPKKLKVLVHEKLGKTIQEGSHDSVDDARAVLELYNSVKFEWEQLIQKQYGKTMKAHASMQLAKAQKKALTQQQEQQTNNRKERIGSILFSKKRTNKSDDDSDNDSNDESDESADDQDSQDENEKHDENKNKYNTNFSRQNPNVSNVVSSSQSSGTRSQIDDDEYSERQVSKKVLKKLKRDAELEEAKKKKPNLSSSDPSSIKQKLLQIKLLKQKKAKEHEKLQNEIKRSNMFKTKV
jgi:RNA exonuclease 4